MAQPLVSDELWEIVEPLIPKVQRRYRSPGRKRIDDRKVLTGILFVLLIFRLFWGRQDRAEPGQSAQVWLQASPDHGRGRHPARLPAHRRQPQRLPRTCRPY
jgi:hypothetical protein